MAWRELLITILLWAADLSQPLLSQGAPLQTLIHMFRHRRRLLSGRPSGRKICYPSTVRNVVTTSFHPYTITESYGPIINGNGGNLWPRIYEGRRWMPFSWVTAGRQVGHQTVPASGISFYGPYMVIDTSGGELPKPGDNAQVGVECTLRITVQFKGQR